MSKKQKPERKSWTPFTRGPKGTPDPASIGNRLKRGPGGILIQIREHGPEHGRWKD